MERHKGHRNDDHHAAHEGGQDHCARLADLQEGQQGKEGGRAGDGLGNQERIDRS